MKKYVRNNLKNLTRSKYMLIIQVAFILMWGSQLLNSDAYYVNYMLLLVIAGICVYINAKSGNLLFCSSHGKKYDIFIYGFSFLFSCMVACANYSIWAFPSMPEDGGYKFKYIYETLLIISIFCGGGCAFGNIFLTIFSNINNYIWSERNKGCNARNVFFISFALLVFTRCIVLFLCQYPGELTPDSMVQMIQLMENDYSNHHPFYHTIVIKFFIVLGLRLFNDINAAVATYMFFQILFTALCFSFAISTMAKIKAPRWIIITSMMFYILMPYHIIFAITMWKDIMFGCFVLLLITSAYRCMNGIGTSFFNYVLLIISSLGICLFRSNGFFVFVILTIAFVIIWRFTNKRILIIFATTIVVSFFMKHAVLAQIGVAQPDTIESLSIPAQQIARVIKEGCELNEWQQETISKIIDVEKVPDSYTPYISDPIKELVRDKGNQNLILEQKGQYIKLYVSLGMKYPMAYIRAWIDETRGYWNAGYEYWRWKTEITANDMGIGRYIRNTALNRLLQEYLWMFTDVQILRIFLSIGLFVWIDILMFMVSLFRKDKMGIYLTLPILAVTASLLVATPVFSELRYMYAAFCSLPMVVVVSLRPIEKYDE